MNKALVLGTSGKERELLANILKELGYLCDTADTAASIENIGEYSIFFLMFEPSEEFISQIENVVRESEEPVFVVTDLPKEDIRKMSVPFGIGAIGGPLELAQVKEQIEYYSLLWNSPLNIIIYEPDKYWNTLLVKYLTEEKHNAMAFDNGERFIYAVLSKKCDIVIVEINTIEELAILEHIVSQKPYAPILLIVPKNSWELTIKALLIGVSQYLHKPIKLQQLSIAINKTLLNSRKEGIERFVASLFNLKTKALSAKFEEILDEMGRREAEIKSLSLYKGSLQVRLLSSVVFGKVVSSVIHYVTNVFASLLSHYELIAYLEKSEKPERIASELDKIKRIMEDVRENIGMIQRFLRQRFLVIPRIFDIVGVISELVEELRAKAEYMVNIIFAPPTEKELNIFGVPDEVKSSLNRIIRKILAGAPEHADFLISIDKKEKEIVVNMEIRFAGLDGKELEKSFKNFEARRFNRKWVELFTAYGTLFAHGAKIFFDSSRDSLRMVIKFPIIYSDELLFPDYSVLIYAKRSPIRDYIVNYLISDGFKADGVGTLGEVKNIIKKTVYSAFIYYTDRSEIPEKELLALASIRKIMPIIVIAPLLKKKPEPSDIFISEPLSPQELGSIIRSFLYFTLRMDRANKTI